jgi:ribosomal subunit interface protein
MSEVELPLEITVRDIENTEAITAKIKKNANKLKKLFNRITFCRVVIEAMQKNKHQGKEFQVSIELDLPGKVLIVNNQSHRNEDLYVAIRDSFDAMKRRLEDYAHIIRGDKKNHTSHLTGKIVRLFPDYGFIETPSGEEYYFNESNLLQGRFSELDVGASVRFIEALAGDSLQAHQVTTL